SNPLIDDYTLKGAKGLLVNITGGKDLKLFEVDEVVNKIRAEVDVEAEVIIGAITDTTLEGKIRVSIVATSLDGQQPEAKSVINMVHRIQNRNPGYSDFPSSGSAQSFNFSQPATSSFTSGANALKLENEITAQTHQEQSTNESIESLNNEYNEQLLADQHSEVENIVSDNLISEKEESFTEEAFSDTQITEKTSNGLENFGVEEETLELFNSENEESNNDLSSLDTEESNSEEDDLEIPAFLRRQKN
ncbi:MAG: cell division protein FtsZ, partial [Flavobacteriaceae bacterium]|nr:cell division protein FtsZ [Flavobacteriaceae bacterium]